MALALEAQGWSSADFWMRRQAAYDLAQARRRATAAWVPAGTGEQSSGSSWTRAPTAEPELAGLLDVVALGGSAYRASFRVSSLEAE